MRVIIACAFALTMVSAPSAAPNLSPKDFDVACAMTNGATMAIAQETAEKRSAAFSLFTFYLGRLSGRDDSTDWNKVVLGRVAELKEKALSDQLFSSCMDFYVARIKQ